MTIIRSAGSSLSPSPQTARCKASACRNYFIFSFTPYETSAIKRVKKVRVLGEDVHFASPEDIIIHKIFAGRPRDIEDIRTIIMKNPSMDFQYIRKWLKEFDASSDKKDFLNTFEDILKGLE